MASSVHDFPHHFESLTLTQNKKSLHHDFSSSMLIYVSCYIFKLGNYHDRAFIYIRSSLSKCVYSVQIEFSSSVKTKYYKLMNSFNIHNACKLIENNLPCGSYNSYYYRKIFSVLNLALRVINLYIPSKRHLFLLFDKTAE